MSRSKEPASRNSSAVEKGQATVLICRRKAGIFSEEIGEEDEFAHEDSEGEFFGFSGKEEALVEDFEDGVITGGDEGGHVKSVADLRSTTTDEALAAELATIVIEGGDAGEGGGLGVGECSEFGHEGNEGEGER